MLSHKYGGENVGVTIFMSQFSMSVPTTANVKLGNVNTGHARIITIILYFFPNLLIVYTVVPVYYFPGHHANTILSGVLKCYAIFENLTSEHIKHCYLF